MKGERETRIDLIRGFSLLAIFIGHSNFGFSEAFQNSRGFSDASELFVLMAGMSCGLAYYAAAGGSASFRRTAARTLRRAFTLYAVHIALVAAVAAATLLPAISTSPSIMHTLGMTGFWNDAAHLAAETVILEFMPADLDILPLYVLLLAIVPAIFHLHDRSPLLLLSVSASIWLAAGAARLNFVNLALPNGHWYFDPLSWQFVFAIGIVLGIRIKKGRDALPYHPALFATAAAAVLFAIPANLLMHFHFTDLSATGAYHALSSKTNVGIVRLVNALAIVYVVWNLGPVRRIDPDGVLRGVHAMGRHSLPVFVTGLVLSIAIAVLMASGLVVPVSLQLLLMVAGCGVQIVLATRLDSRRPVRLPADAAVPRADAAVQTG